LKIVHIIIGLNVGGAELMLKRLLQSQKAGGITCHSVISLTNIGVIGEQLLELGVDVKSLEMRGLLDVPKILVKLIQSIKEAKPDVVQTWMYHADLLGGLSAKLAGNYKVVWGIRGTGIPQKGLSSTKVIIWACAILSKTIPSLIVCCAEAAKVAHEKMGYSSSKMRVINNGYDLSRFKRTPTMRNAIREEFDLTGSIVIGIVGRFDPLKDYHNFVLATSLVAERIAGVKFFLIGRDVDSNNELLLNWIEEGGWRDQYILAGERSDIPSCLAAMDLFCLSSMNEGFPNVVCEAMAMEVPCVVTRAGDAELIVSDTGGVVDTRDPIALADELFNMVSLSKDELVKKGRLARLRVEEKYSIECASKEFVDLYTQLAND